MKQVEQDNKIRKIVLAVAAVLIALNVLPGDTLDLIPGAFDAVIAAIAAIMSIIGIVKSGNETEDITGQSLAVTWKKTAINFVLMR